MTISQLAKGVEKDFFWMFALVLKSYIFIHLAIKQRLSLENEKT